MPGAEKVPGERGGFSSSPEEGRQSVLSLGQAEDASVYTLHFFFSYLKIFSIGKGHLVRNVNHLPKSSGRGVTGVQEPLSTAGGCSAHLL